MLGLNKLKPDLQVQIYNPLIKGIYQILPKNVYIFNPFFYPSLSFTFTIDE